MQTNYYDTPAISQSGIKCFVKEGAHTYWRHSPFNPSAITQKDTVALLRGKLVDVLLFEPEKFDSIYAVKEKVDGRTTAGKLYNIEFEEANVGKVIIDKAEMEESLAMVITLKQNVDFQEQTKGEWLTQEEFFWEEGGAAFKAKMDLIVKHEDGSYTIFDYKTCQNCDEQHFGADIIRFGYHIQAAFYKHAFRLKYGVEAKFVLIPQEKEFPEAIALYEVQPCDIAIGQRTIVRAVKDIKTRLASGNWRPYKGGIQSMNLPTWFYTKQQEEESNDEN